MFRMTWLVAAVLLSPNSITFAENAAPISHGFLVTGGETYLQDADGKVLWSFPKSTRDGWVLPNGNLLLAVSRSNDGGSVVEVTRDGQTVFEFKGTQSEVNTVEPLANGNILLTEAGDKPRIMEVTRDGTIAVDVPIQAQTKDHHLQTRMTRKLANGNYLVPQLLDKVVREYQPDGKVVWEVATPNWPFTAIRLDNGNTLVNCTIGNLTIEVDKDGKTIWEISNDDFAEKPFADACGGQRLPNGNTVITAYNAKPGQIKLFEVTREKKIVWTYTDQRGPGIHHFQILDTNGKPVVGRPLR